MKTLPISIFALLAGCASVNYTPRVDHGHLPFSSVSEWPAPGKPNAITILDTRTIRALRKHGNDYALNLSGAAKIGLWVGVGVGSLMLIDALDDAEDEFSECLASFFFDCGESD